MRCKGGAQGGEKGKGEDLAMLCNDVPRSSQVEIEPLPL